MAVKRPSINDRITEAFVDYFDTLALIRRYLAERRHPVELAILACVRLDSLANLALSGKTQRERFVHFIEDYSGQKGKLQSVAVPNMYSYLARHHEILSLNFETPGRVTLLSRLDLPFLQFVDKSALPVTEEVIGVFLRWLSRVIQKRYRTTASQSKDKITLDTQDSFVAYLENVASSRRSNSYKVAVGALRPMVQAFSVSSLLYSEFSTAAAFH
jgi:hypothetical protein